MRNLFLLVLALALIVGACQKDSVQDKPNQQELAVDMSDFYVFTDDAGIKSAPAGHVHGPKCGSMQVLNRKLKENPGLEKRMYDIEKHVRTVIAAKGGKGDNFKKPGTGDTPGPYVGNITIPVIVNIIEHPDHPISTQHINSQIAILNDDFNDKNPNTGGVPAEFNDVVANCDINFVLAGTNKITSTVSSWGTNDAMKYSSQGGIDATDPAHYLNIWVCEIGGGILGYAQFPGGDPETDGVVIGSDFFGENAAGGVYGHGRTATHEVGHWLNLRHIWGDGRCRQDDFVTDTPSSDQPNYGCPSYPTVHCKSNDMTMNYMDYVYDDCMYMFTVGQNDRIRSIFATGGARESFVQ